jgi:hypothetical protein
MPVSATLIGVLFTVGAGLVGIRGSFILPLPLRAIRKLLENVVAAQLG